MAAVPERVSPYRALGAFLFCREKYLRLAIQHNMAISLESPDILEAFKSGSYPRGNWEQEALEGARTAANELSKAIWSSFCAVAVAAIVAVVIVYGFGKVATDLPVSWSKVLSACGGFLAAWATLMELGGLIETYSGQALHELVHPALFKMLFVPGFLLALAGQLW